MPWNETVLPFTSLEDAPFLPYPLFSIINGIRKGTSSLHGTHFTQLGQQPSQVLSLYPSIMTSYPNSTIEQVLSCWRTRMLRTDPD